MKSKTLFEVFVPGEFYRFEYRRTERSFELTVVPRDHQTRATRRFKRTSSHNPVDDLEVTMSRRKAA